MLIPALKSFSGLAHRVQAIAEIKGVVWYDDFKGTNANAMSVRLELQADCFAGVWAFHSQAAKQWLDQGDVAEALNAASHIGDDALQQASQGRVVPESFTHGSSQQRVGWFQRGMAGGRVQDCNTFEARQL